MCQRGDRLEGLDVPADPGLVQAAVGVRHQRQGQREDARIAGQRAVGQLGQLRVVAARQVVLDLAEGVLDDVEIIGEPLGLEAPGPGMDGVLDDPAVRLDQDAPVLREAAEQGGAHSGPRGRHGGRREFPGVRLQVIQAEQLGPDRLLAVGVDERRGVTFGEGRDVCRGFFEGCAHVTDVPGSTCPCDRSPFLARRTFRSRGVGGWARRPPESLGSRPDLWPGSCPRTVKKRVRCGNRRPSMRTGRVPMGRPKESPRISLKHRGDDLEIGG